jgi:hypothetical protein
MQSAAEKRKLPHLADRSKVDFSGQETPSRKSRFTDSQIVNILAAGPVPPVAAAKLQQSGISNATYFHWRPSTSGRRSTS